MKEHYSKRNAGTIGKKKRGVKRKLSEDNIREQYQKFKMNKFNVFQFPIRAVRTFAPNMAKNLSKNK